MAKDSKSKKLYEFRNKNYNSNSPHYIELNKLVKRGTKEELVSFGTERLLEGESFDEYMEAVDARFPEGEKAPRSEKDEDVDVDL